MWISYGKFCFSLPGAGDNLQWGDELCFKVGGKDFCHGRPALGASPGGCKEKASAPYQDFLHLWKDADADIPILKEARVEYAKLQQPLHPTGVAEASRLTFLVPRPTIPANGFAPQFIGRGPAAAFNTPDS